GFAEGRFEVLGLRNRFAPEITAAISAVSRSANALFIGAVAVAGLAALGHLIVTDYPLSQLVDHVVTGIPFLDPAGLSLAIFFLGLAAVGWFVGIRWVRLGLTGLGLGLLIYSASFEIALPVVAVAWGVLTVVSLGTVRRLVVLPLDPGADRITLTTVVERTPFAASALGLGFLIAEALGYATPEAINLHIQGLTQLGGTPFLDEATFVLATLALTALACGWTWGGDRSLALGGIGAAAALAWLLPLEVRSGYAVAGWSALALGCLAATRRLPGGRMPLAWAALALMGTGALVTLVYVAPPSRLVVDPSTVVLGWPLLSDATVALGSLAIALALGGRLYGDPRWVAPALALAGATVVYLLSVAVVDRFQAQVGSQPLDVLQKEAQVALSVLWSGLGAVAFAVGIASHRSQVRLFGLVLLGIATTKVFLVDLAFLDVAYRVLSLVALGVVLLVSAAIFSRTQRAAQ
ncbi:MAG TPA: DUF2339 domain-containing protein, partial [Candidatus Binatia bacterium]|nr:DUF2339 domain-containing protein [Candidatus Binatia bacterium]